MGKLLRFILGVVGFIVIVPLLLIAAFFITFDADGFKKEITQQASTAIGRDITLDGPISLNLEHGLALSVANVRVGNPAGFKEKEFVKAGKVSVSVNWKALVDHKIDVQQITLEDATINMVTSASGENNWEIKLPKSAEAAPATPAPAPTKEAVKQEAGTTTDIEPNFKIDRVDLNAIEILKTTVRQIDERKGKSQELVVTKANIKAPSNAALNIGIQGAYNKAPFTAEFTAPGGLQELAEGKPAQIDLRADYAGQSYAVKGTYNHTPKTQDIKNLQAKVMGFDFTGNISVHTDGEVPRITGNLSSPEINLQSLNKNAQKSVQKKSHAVIQTLVMTGTQSANMIVAEAAPDFKALKAVNADIALNIARLVFAEGKELDNVKTNLALNGGRLRLDPFSATFLNVAYKGSLDFNAATNTPVTHLVLSGNNIDFPALASALGSKSPLSANGDLDIDITGQGLAPDSFKNTLSGKIQMTAGKGAVDLGSSGAAGINLIRMLYPRTQATEKQNINCGVLRFNAVNGVLHANGILFDSPLAAVAGEGSVDLIHDNANLLFRHAVKDAQAGSLLNVPIKATGPLAALNFAPEEKAVVEKAMGALMGGGAVSTGVPKVDMNAKGNPCVAAINNPQPMMLEQMKPQEAVKATINQAKDIIKNIKPQETLDKLKGLFR